MAKASSYPSKAPSTCEFCGQEFFAARTNIKHQRFCSSTCSGKHRQRKWLESEHCPKIGQKFGDWTVIAYSHCQIGWRGNTHTFLCRCSCGREKTILAVSLLNGSAKRCHKCARPQPPAARHGGARNQKPTLTYRSWIAMRQRCNNPKASTWPDYGGAGIHVCERWDSFENFLADMGERPSREHTLDRIDGTQGYFPGNCRWATVKQQNNNQKSCRLLTWGDRTQTLAQWAEELGLTYATLAQRIRKGWTVERAFTEPFHPSHSNRKSQKPLL